MKGLMSSSDWPGDRFECFLNQFQHQTFSHRPEGHLLNSGWRISPFGFYGSQDPGFRIQSFRFSVYARGSFHVHEYYYYLLRIYYVASVFTRKRSLQHTTITIYVSCILLQVASFQPRISGQGGSFFKGPPLLRVMIREEMKFPRGRETAAGNGFPIVS